ncbi:MAG TPA: GNAT family N-acetyltransferase [Oculatellaceae cyanobacterium]|jgi:hypothetical protein
MNTVLESLSIPSSDLPLNEESYPYETSDFHGCWWRYLAPRFDIPYKQRDILVHRKKFLKGLLRVREARISGWNSAWSQDLTAERVTELDAVKSRYGWDCFRYIWNENRQHLQQFEQLADLGYPIIHREAPLDYVADLSQGYEAYLNTLSHNGRTNLRKKVRRAQALHPHLEPVTKAADIEAFFEEFFSHHIPYWTQKNGYSYFSHPEERHFIVEWAKMLHTKGQIILDRLIMEKETTNLSVRLLFGKNAYFLLTINTGRKTDFIPGIVGFAMRIQDLAERGIQLYNLGAGDFFYKVQSASWVQSRWETIVFNPASMKGKLAYQWMSRKKPGKTLND